MNDLINGAFEALAGLFVLNHCRAVLKDKAVAGVSVVSVVFFSAWGFWNLYYYPSLGQVWSFYGGLLIVFANIAWVFLLLKYRGNSK
jgi:hypothetical protein